MRNNFFWDRLLALAFVSALCTGAFVFAEDSARRPVVVLLPLENEGQVEQLDTIGRTIRDVAGLTLKLMGKYQVSEDDVIIDYTDNNVIREYAEESKADNVIFGRLFSAEGGGLIIEMSVYSRSDQKVTIERRESFESIFTVFEASEKLIDSLIEGFSNIRLAFGSLNFVNSGAAGDYTVLVDGEVIGESLTSIERVFVGPHRIRIAQKRMFEDATLLDVEVFVAEDREITLSFPIPYLTEREARLIYEIEGMRDSDSSDDDSRAEIASEAARLIGLIDQADRISSYEPIKNALHDLSSRLPDPRPTIVAQVRARRSPSTEIERTALLTQMSTIWGPAVPYEETEYLMNRPQEDGIAVLYPHSGVSYVLRTSIDDGQIYRYTFAPPDPDWMKLDFDDDNWESGEGGFGRGRGGTYWDTNNIWLRRRFQLDEIPLGQLYLAMFHDKGARVFLNGTEIANHEGFTDCYELTPLQRKVNGFLRVGENVITIHCEWDSGGQFIDLGLIEYSDLKLKSMLKKQEASAISSNLVDSIPVTKTVAYYPFNENADDESGNGFDGTIHDATFTFRRDHTGAENFAYRFIFEKYIQLPRMGEQEEIGISFIFNPMQDDSTGIFYDSSDIKIHFRKPAIRFFVRGAEPEWQQFRFDFGRQPWYQVLIQYSVKSKSAELSVNGKIVERIEYKSAPGRVTISPARIGSVSYERLYFKGILDEYCIFNELLTETEVESLYGLR